MRILFLDSVHPSLSHKLNHAGHECFHDYKTSRTSLREHILTVDGLIFRSRFLLDENFLDYHSHLKFIARFGAGMEHINLDVAKKNNIICLNCPEGSRQAVGEHTLGLLLSVLNKIPQADFSIREGEWLREKHRGTEISGKTIGIIGFGNMGKAFAKVLQGFDCQILYHDLKKINSPWKNTQQVSLEELQENADILSFHIPETLDNDYYFNERFLYEMMKPFFLINTARGSVVETNALVRGLEQKKILGAGLDVLEYENMSFSNLFKEENDLPKNLKKLLMHQNVIVTPHISGFSEESGEKMADIIFKKIQDLKF